MHTCIASTLILYLLVVYSLWIHFWKYSISIECLIVAPSVTTNFILKNAEDIETISNMYSSQETWMHTCIASTLILYLLVVYSLWIHFWKCSICIERLIVAHSLTISSILKNPEDIETISNMYSSQKTWMHTCLVSIFILYLLVVYSLWIPF
jgi:hypothetical protein